MTSIDFVDALDNFQPDVILSDNELPQFSAAEALKIVQQKLLHIPFILVTGTVSEEFAVAVIKAGADDYLLKDRLARLPAAIESALKQKQAENDTLAAALKLQQSEQLYRNLFENMLHGFAYCKVIYSNDVVSDFVFLNANNEFERILALNDISLSKASEVLPGVLQSDPTYLQLLHNVATHGQSVKFDTYLQPKDVWLSASLYCPQPGYFVALIDDISARKKGEAAIKESEARVRKIFDSNLIGFIFWNAGGEIVEANDAFLDMVGYTQHDLEKGLLRWNEMTPPEYAYLDVKGLQEIVETGSCQPFEKEYIRKDGTRVPIVIGATSISDSFNEKGVSFVLDITERKTAEKKLKSTNDELRSLSAHLQNVREEERMHIAREIHDELGQQLTGLKMDVSWLNSKLPQKNQLITDKVKEILELIDDTVNSVRRISTNLRPAILDDLGLIAALEWQSAEVEKRSNIEVEFNCNLSEAEIPFTIITGLFRIFQEALTNAVRHSNAHKIESTLHIGESGIVLRVTDNGKGIEKNSGTRKSFGLLGIKERTFLLNGKVEINSVPGKGTTIEVYIPHHFSK